MRRLWYAKPMRPLLTLAVALLLAVPAMAQDVRVNLILSPHLVGQEAPFYRGARVKIGDEVIPVQETDLPAGALAEYNPQLNAVLISSDANTSLEAKSLALMDVLAAMEAGAIQTAAGREQ